MAAVDPTYICVQTITNGAWLMMLLLLMSVPASSSQRTLASLRQSVFTKHEVTCQNTVSMMLCLCVPPTESLTQINDHHHTSSAATHFLL